MANYTATAAGTGDVAVRAGRGRLLGVSARESGTVPAAAAFVLRDGVDATGSAVAFVEVGADQSVNISWGDIDGIEFFTGLFLDRTAGATEVTVYT